MTKVIDNQKLTIGLARKMLEGKEISVEELRNLFVGRIKERNPAVNAYLSVFETHPGESAPRPSANASRLSGMPCIIKDNILVEGKKATGGSKILENYLASYDATVVAKLKQSGADILGKGNLDEFAMGSTGEYSAFGVTHNPYDLSRVAGGSSSGPAAAVADGQAIFGLGSDTGGSIRTPAAFCGVVGLKPTYGRVSRFGLMAMASSFDQIGPITQNVEDAAEVLSVIAGRDYRDSTSSPSLVPDFAAGLGESIAGLRVGVPREFNGYGLDVQVKEKIEVAIKKLESLGAKIIDISLPMTEYALAAYYIIVPSEISANLARYDGIRYGLSERKKAGNLLEVYVNSRDEGFGPEVKRRIMIGTYALSAGYYDAYYAKAQKVRTLIRKQFSDVFKKCDIIAGPTTPTMAPKIGELGDPLAFYLADIFTVQANLAGLPAISIPCGFGQEEGVKLPVGFQMMADYFKEDLLLKAAYALEQHIK